MSLAQALTVYISMNILIVCGCISLLVFSFFAKIIKTKFSSKAELNLHYFLLLAILTLTLVQPLMPQKDVFSPAAKVWSAQSIDQFNYEYQSLSSAGYLSMTTPIGASIFRAEQVSEIWTLAGVLLLFLGVFFIFRDLRKLLRLQKDSYSVRKIGQVQIFLSETVQVPFSYWLPGQANIVLPTNLVERPREYRIAIAHELQHHRNRDTKWVYVLWGLRLICVINPAIHFWNRWITEIQEFACDETLVDQRKVQSQAYARCLVEVAQSAINQKYVPVCATGLMFLIGRNLLKRRIEKMFDKSTKKMTKVRQFNISLAVGIFMSLAMGATALAAKGLIQDRRVSMAQAKVMATKAQRDTGIPIV